LMLPDPANGPAAMLIGPHSGIDDMLLSHYASATFAGYSDQLGGPPYRLYVVQSRASAGRDLPSFAGELHLLDTQHLSYNGAALAVTHWNIQRTVAPAFRTTYIYNFINMASTSANLKVKQQQCEFTSMQAGDQLVVSYQIPGENMAAQMLNFQVERYNKAPLIVSQFGLAFETNLYVEVEHKQLKTTMGQSYVQVPIK
jgi:hypothetical protein